MVVVMKPKIDLSVGQRIADLNAKFEELRKDHDTLRKEHDDLHKDHDKLKGDNQLVIDVVKHLPLRQLLVATSNIYWKQYKK